jgi:VWFA-related protein
VSSARAQEGGQPSQFPGIFGETIQVRVVNLEVVVTDRQGNPVTGLKPESFRLFVDGKPRPIEYFTEIAGGHAEHLPASGQVTATPSVSPGEDIGTSYLLFIDDYFSIRRDRDRVLREIAQDLPVLGPYDRMAVVAFDGKNLDMISTWSQSPSELDRALKEAMRRDALGLHRLMERRQVDFDRILELTGTTVTNVNDVTPALTDIRSSFSTRLTPIERQYVSRLSHQLGEAVAAASAAMRGFANPPGRKVLLLLSGGWPMLPALYTVGSYTNLRWLYETTSEGQSLYVPLIDTANRLGYTIYAVDVPGFQSTAGVSVEQSAPIGGQIQSDTSVVREREADNTLRLLATATGGEALINSGRDHALERSFEDTRSYYWLGFTPPNEGDDQRHDVRVEVTDPHLRVRSRGSYLDSSRSTEATMAVESALLFGNPPGSGNLPVKVGKVRHRGRRIEVPVTFAIPTELLTVLPQGRVFTAAVEARFAVIDEQGNRAPIPTLPLEFRFDRRPPPGRYVTYKTTLKLRDRAHDLVVGVLDPASGHLVTGTARITP